MSAAAAVDNGASIIIELQGSATGGCVVMADPWGNEFCFVADAQGTWESSQIAALDAMGALVQV